MKHLFSFENPYQKMLIIFASNFFQDDHLCIYSHALCLSLRQIKKKMI